MSPSEQELILYQKNWSFFRFLKASLDEEETSRIDIEDNNMIVILDIPFTEMEDNSLTYDTYPLAIINTPNNIITVCLKIAKF